MNHRRRAIPGSPPAAGVHELEVMKLGDARYFTPPPTAKANGEVIPAGDGGGLPWRPAPGFEASKVPLVPTAEEVAALPKCAQAAFAERCVRRVKLLPVPPDMTAAAAARLLFESATIDTPLTAQLRCIRRDFARLKRLAREQKWTDDTPVPPDVFGPLWPPGVAPHWAEETPSAGQ